MILYSFLLYNSINTLHIGAKRVAAVSVVAHGRDSYNSQHVYIVLGTRSWLQLLVGSLYLYVVGTAGTCCHFLL